MLEFDVIRLAVIFILTMFCYFFATKKIEAKQSIFLLFCFSFIMLYSGIGGALMEANPEYTFFYIIYLFVLVLTIKRSSLAINYTKDNLTLVSFFERHAKKFLFLYFFIIFLGFIIPEVKIQNLISPPSPSLEDFNFEEEGNTYKGGIIGSILYLLKSFIFPFFYLGLYKYRQKPLKLILFLFLDLYFAYCSSGYIGRGTILQSAIIAFFCYYNVLNRKKRKILIILVIIISPFILAGFYYYSLIRMGKSLSGETISQAVEILFGQEIGYPLHYDDYIKFKDYHIVDYMLWLILLPLPGFLKFGYGSYFLNREFSVQILGVEPSDTTFFVVLPGVVGESIYVFGPYLFWLHAVILGLFIKFVIKTFTSSDVFTYLFFFCIVRFSFMLARAGTISVYPMMLKSFLILVIVCSLICKNKQRKVISKSV